MQRDIESKRFKVSDYKNQIEMNLAVKEYMDRLRRDYPFYLVTKEFCSNRDVLVRMTKSDTRKINDIRNKLKQQEKEREYYIEPRERDREKERQRMRERLRNFSRGGRGRGRSR